jgi:hypothetical protein
LVGCLAQFFPAGTPVHLPVRVILEAGESEQTVIEFGTAQEVLFASALPLEFGQRLRVRNIDASLDTEALIVAMQFPHQDVETMRAGSLLPSGPTAVAARFTEQVSNWIIKP